MHVPFLSPLFYIDCHSKFENNWKDDILDISTKNENQALLKLKWSLLNLLIGVNSLCHQMVCAHYHKNSPTWALCSLVLLRLISRTPLSNFPAFSSKNRSSSYNQVWCSKCSLIESNSSTQVSPITSISLEAKMQKFHSLSSASAMSENRDRISSLILVMIFFSIENAKFWPIWAILSQLFPLTFWCNFYRPK